MSGTDQDVTVRAAEISAKRMMKDLRVLAQWTKHAGTPGELASLARLRSELDAHGYRTELVQHDAYISLPGAALVRIGDHELPALAHSFSTSTGANGVSGQLVHVGDGTAADYAGVDVAGRVVLIDGVAGPAQTLEAGRRGVLAQVHVSPHEHLHEMCVSPVWGSPDDQRLGQLPAAPVVSVSHADGGRLLARCQAGASPTVTVRAEVDTGWRSTPILVAELGTGAVDEPFVLFSGHHDTWHHGVMDNGTANVTMLEVARLLAADRARWRRALRLVFWSGHSQGRYSSSAWYADHHWEELEARAVAHVNIDSTGGRGNTVVADATSAAELGELARTVLWEHAGQQWTGRRMQRAGDQAFWGIGVPAIFGNMGEQPADPASVNAQAAVFGREPRQGSGTGWWWHTPYDLLEHVDPEILVRDTAIYLHTVDRLLTDPVLPFDFTATATLLADRLRELADSAGAGLSLELPIARAERLGELVGRLDRLRRAHQLDPDWLNHHLMRLSRLLTPVEYSSGDRFGHDPALPAEAIPALADVPRLASQREHGADTRFLYSRLVRERARVAVALRDAVELVERALTEATRLVVQDEAQPTE